LLPLRKFKIGNDAIESSLLSSLPRLR
jgi:hypothetical protein